MCAKESTAREIEEPERGGLIRDLGGKTGHRRKEVHLLPVFTGKQRGQVWREGCLHAWSWKAEGISCPVTSAMQENGVSVPVLRWVARWRTRDRKEALTWTLREWEIGEGNKGDCGALGKWGE